MGEAYRSSSVWADPLLVFFFFQAEDGIRAGTVTGVQTCALPISSPRPDARRATCMNQLNASRSFVAPRSRVTSEKESRPGLLFGMSAPPSKYSTFATRSEERRVGKECRSRGAPYQ